MIAPISLSRVLRCFVLALLAVSTGGCYTDCSTRVDQAVADGVVRDQNDAAVAAVSVYAQEDPDHEPHWGLSVFAIAPAGSTTSALAGHITGARLIASTGEVLFEIPMPAATPGAQTFLNGQVHLPTRSAYLHVRDALLTGRARVVIESSVAGLESLSTLLSSTQYNPPRTRSCPYT